MLLVKLITVLIAKLIEFFAKAVPIVHKVTMHLQHALIDLNAYKLLERNVSIWSGVARMQTCRHTEMTQQTTHCTALGEYGV